MVCRVAMAGGEVWCISDVYMGEDKLLYVVKLNKFPNILPFPRMLNNTNEILIVIYKRD